MSLVSKCDTEEIYNIRLHVHNMLEYVFNGNIGAPVIEKLENGAKVLELGCMGGIWANEIAHEYPNTAFYGADAITPSSHGNMIFIECNIFERLPFSDEEFDYVYSRNGLNFFRIDRFQGFLSEVLRILKPGGWLEVEVIDRLVNGGGAAFVLWNSAWFTFFKTININMDLFLYLEDYLEKTQKFECIEHQTAKLFTGNGNHDIGEISSDVFIFTLKNMKEIILPFMGISGKAYDDLVKEIVIELKSGKSQAYAVCHKIIGKKYES